MKNKNLAAVLAIVLGGIGVHKFYLGKTIQGIIYVVLAFTGVSILLGIIEGIYYFIMSKDKFNEKYCGIPATNGNKLYKDALYTLLGINGQLYVYDNRIIIERKGVLGTLTAAAAGTKTIPFKSIQSLQFKEGGSAINGFIQFGIIGGIEKNGGIFSATDDENTVFFKNYQNNNAIEIKNFIEGKIY